MSLPGVETGVRYPLNVGERDRRRLELTNAIYNPSTFDFLKAYLPADGRILEAGCGHGQVSRWLCANGRGSHVTGIDQDPAQIRVAAKNQGATGDKLQFEAFDITGANFVSRFEASFELVFCRFTLLHILSLDTAIANLFACVKPGGYLVIEEPSLASLFSIPYFEAFHTANDAIRMYGKLTGISYDCAERVWPSIHRLEGSIDRVRFSQPTIWGSQHKELVLLSFMQLGPVLVERGIIDKQTLHDVIAELRGRFMQPEVITGGLRTIQLAFTRAA